MICMIFAPTDRSSIANDNERRHQCFNLFNVYTQHNQVYDVIIVKISERSNISLTFAVLDIDYRFYSLKLMENIYMEVLNIIDVT